MARVIGTERNFLGGQGTLNMKENQHVLPGGCPHRTEPVSRPITAPSTVSLTCPPSSTFAPGPLACTTISPRLQASRQLISAGLVTRQWHRKARAENAGKVRLQETQIYIGSVADRRMLESEHITSPWRENGLGKKKIRVSYEVFLYEQALAKMRTVYSIRFGPTQSASSLVAHHSFSSLLFTQNLSPMLPDSRRGRFGMPS
jgi:hypothetical protein